MKGDFSRLSFDALRSFAGVLREQGRMELDADFNEAVFIQLDHIRKTTADLIGPHGGPAKAFELSAEPGGLFDLRIGPGRYYADGWLAFNPSLRRYADQGLGAARPGRYVAYLEIWDRTVSPTEFDARLPSTSPNRLADAALGGTNTAARIETVWALRLAPAPGPGDGETLWAALKPALKPSYRGRLAVLTQGYSGLENCHYRFEVYKGGAAGRGASFIWSRRNASAVFAVELIATKALKLAPGPLDEQYLRPGALATLETPLSLTRDPAPLVQIGSWRSATRELSLRSDPPPGVTSPAVLRIWDHQSQSRPGKFGPKAIPIVEGTPIPIEDGLSVWFAPEGACDSATYQSGDYWLAPARAAISGVLWPSVGGEPSLIPPHGVERQFAPLGIVSFEDNGEFRLEQDLRRIIRPLAGA